MKQLFRLLPNKLVVMQTALFLLINSLFISKYISRLQISPFLGVGVYLSIVFLIFSLIKYINILSKNQLRLLFYTSITFILISAITLIYSINPYTINVDRWSAIHNFIKLLFDGQYPYLAKTHLGGYGSPFPIWQYIHIPFYLLGNVSLGMVFSLILLTYILSKYTNDYKTAILFVLLILISPAFWYEVSVRSDLFYNLLLCLLMLIVWNEKKLQISKHPILLGIICGLFISTRLSVFFPFYIFLFKDFWNCSNNTKFQFIFSSLVSFFLSFLPLLLWDSNALLTFKYNPFVLQTRQGSIFEIVIMLIITLIQSFLWNSDFIKCNHYISISLTFLVVITFSHNMYLDNFSQNLFSNKYDITYFNMALPFCIYAISKGLEREQQK
jgi:hypothetical protein